MMSKLRTIKSLVNERLTAAAVEIFGIFETTVGQYESEAFRARQEIEQQRKLLDLVLKPDIKLLDLVLKPDIKLCRDHLQLPVYNEEAHPEQQERSPSLGQEEPEPLQIKEEELFQQQEVSARSRSISQPMKCENEEEDTQWSQLSQTLKEESGESDPLPGTSRDRMNTEPDGEDCWVSEPYGESWGVSEPDGENWVISEHDAENWGVSEPDRENWGVSERTSDIEPVADVLILSSEHSGSETEDSDNYSKGTREPHSGLNSKSKKTQDGQRSSASGTLKRPAESLHDPRTSQVPSTSRCRVCGESFPNAVFLTRHARVHPDTCGLCEKRTDSTEESLASHLQVHWKCDICGKGFPTDWALGVHKRIHAGDRPFGCPECDKSFMNKAHLTIHMRGHTGEKPYNCSFCNRSFGHKSNMTMHMRSHTGEKPFSCAVCHKGFGRMFTLKRHMTAHKFNQAERLAVHTAASRAGEKPFSCSICNNRFGRNSTLKRHMRYHTGDKPFGCTECDKTFHRKEYLTAHVLKHRRAVDLFVGQVQDQGT